jgi:hypothetical protein
MTPWTNDAASDDENLISWVQWVREQGVTSFVGLALVNPHAWENLKDAPQLRNQIASILGWPMTIDSRLLEQRRVLDMAAVLLNRGYADGRKVWADLPTTCHRLHQHGDLADVFSLAGLAAIEGAPSSLSAMLNRAREFGTLNSWLQSDLEGVQQVCVAGWQANLAVLVPSRPEDGWPTHGGPVFDTASLIVARYLELHDIHFLAPLFGEHGGTPHVPRAFRLSDHHALLRITGSGGDEDEGVCAEGQTLRVLLVDETLLHTSLHVVAFAFHLRFVLADAGIVTKGRALQVIELLRPEPLTVGYGASKEGG